MAERFLARWERFWFGEASLVNLALFRIVLLCAAFDGVWVVRQAVFQNALGENRAGFIERGWSPIYAFELLGLGPPGPVAVQVLWIALLAAIACGILGLCTRLACALTAVLFFYWVGSEYGFGKPHHTCVALQFGLLALPFGPVGARLSLDSLHARLAGEPRPERAPWALFPLRVTQITLVFGYFFAGATKLAISGLGWANGYTLMGVMTEYRSPWSEHFYGSPGLLVFLSLGLLAGQVGFPLVALGTFWRWVFVPIAVVFHLMAMKTMGTGPFLTLWLALSAFVALDRLPGVLTRHVGAGPLARRLAIGGVLAAMFGTTAWIYFTHKPAWLALALVPLVVTLLWRALPRVFARLVVHHDPDSVRARRALAWLAACDWAGRLEFHPTVGQAAPLRVLTPDGRERSPMALLPRLPLGPLVYPFFVSAFRRG